MNIICLHACDNMSLELLINKINSKGAFSLHKYEQIEEKKNIHIYGAKTKVKRQYCRQHLKIKAEKETVNLWIENGVAVVNDTIIHQNDIYITYSSKFAKKVEKLTEQFLQTMSFVLVEPDMYERIKQLQGSFNPLTLPAYQKSDINSGVYCHLCWQIYAINAAWEKFLKNPLERVPLRQLRVKIRRLRSCISFFKPALKLVECTQWQKKMRAQGEELGSLREFDVIIMSLKRMQEITKEDLQKPCHLEKIFVQARTAEVKRIRTQLNLKPITLELTQLLLWVQNRPVAPAYSAKTLKKFLFERLKQWSGSIMVITERYPEFSDMQAAHKIRIKVKRFRYALMSFPEINKGAGNMLRKLKRLQDMLGFLHDDYVNSKLAETVIEADNDALYYEVAVFSGWESAKVEASINMLEYLWEDFCTELKVWKNKA